MSAILDLNSLRGLKIARKILESYRDEFLMLRRNKLSEVENQYSNLSNDQKLRLIVAIFQKCTIRLVYQTGYTSFGLLYS